MKMIQSLKTFAFASVLGLGLLTPVYVYADDDEETPLTEEMDVISGSLKKLRKAETTADKVALVHDAQKSTLKSLEYLPMIFKDIKDEKEKAKSTADYKRLVGSTYVQLCELELAFLAEDEEKSDEILDKLKDLKKEGHKKYTD